MGELEQLDRGQVREAGTRRRRPLGGAAGWFYGRPGKRGRLVVQTHETAQCEWERLTWPFAASAFPVPRVRFCLVVLL